MAYRVNVAEAAELEANFPKYQFTKAIEIAQRRNGKLVKNDETTEYLFNDGSRFVVHCDYCYAN